MTRLKRWESPRREGRNDKGKGGAAKKKQWQKRLKTLRNKLKNNQQGGVNSSLFLWEFLLNSGLGTCQINVTLN
ncbi:hypothetical protein [Geminocystis sp. GBBB08]|uniref:hypothetical protein n=1 Tax=Geminocystis sp. GBBB08 TaxID=2604140 RepID=UPI0027E25EF7|nr:hypothetical protein [Geminocystis sp. GBBB08]MBL1209623.1 hypothetical protein [Geminocystis sp. GBBB08]